ncbi:MAG: NusG domain II-containing protein [Treponema sp.]|nr:NusG domain II-containing protein [Treponema sp.]
MEKRLKFFDAAFILLFLAVLFCSVFQLKKESRKPSVLFVQAPGSQFVYSLEKDGTHEFEGLIGTTSVQIKNGKACVVHSPCENKTCIAAGEIWKNGQWAACLPNGIFLRIEGAADSEFDAAAQ